MCTRGFKQSLCNIICFFSGADFDMNVVYFIEDPTPKNDHISIIQESVYNNTKIVLIVKADDSDTSNCATTSPANQPWADLLTDIRKIKPGKYWELIGL